MMTLPRTIPKKKGIVGSNNVHGRAVRMQVLKKAVFFGRGFRVSPVEQKSEARSTPSTWEKDLVIYT